MRRCDPIWSARWLARRAATLPLLILLFSGVSQFSTSPAAAAITSSTTASETSRSISAAPDTAPSISTAPDRASSISAALSVEEARLDRPIQPGLTEPMPPQIIERAGFTPLVRQFAVDLKRTRTARATDRLVRRSGERLWRAAVRRVQGPADTRPGALPVDDDRPLYWTRLSLARTLRQWQPSFPATAADQAAWQKQLEYSSRGLTTSRFTDFSGNRADTRPGISSGISSDTRPGISSGTRSDLRTGSRSSTRRLFVSGFDPFGLDTQLRTGNPSGASALHLDGRTLTVDGLRVQVQAVVLPVRYPDFDAGIVEDAFGPHLRPGPQHADLVSTTSQGRVGRFDLEVFNGRRRSTTYPDNLNGQGGGTLNQPVIHPGVGPGAEFIRSTLPMAPMQAAGVNQRFPVIVHSSVVEIPSSATEPVTRPDGPTEGSIAVEGGGGGYLSNESAYRVTRLLTTSPNPPPGGHVHLPVMSFGPDNSTEITDPVFEQNRAIVNETQNLLLAAVSAQPSAAEGQFTD